MIGFGVCDTYHDLAKCSRDITNLFSMCPLVLFHLDGITSLCLWGDLRVSMPPWTTPLRVSNICQGHPNRTGQGQAPYPSGWGLRVECWANNFTPWKVCFRNQNQHSRCETVEQAVPPKQEWINWVPNHQTHCSNWVHVGTWGLYFSQLRRRGK